MLDYLSTDEILNKIKIQETTSTKIVNLNPTKQKRVKIRRVFKVMYFIVMAVAFIHVIYLLLQLVINDRGMSVFGQATIVAVPIDQEIDIINDEFEVAAKVVVMRRFNPEELEVGDLVIIYGKFGSDYYWVERVVSFDMDNKEITTTIDNFFASDDVTSFEDITGYYVREAGLSGAINYVSSNPRGYIITLFTYALILYVLYYAYKAEEKRYLKKTRTK